ncbi:MAG: DUF883 domain-containing protein [Proteobacteria bacterium]|nr:DUF883 domain-containing protein [Pseudomonadota bacterium]
MAAQDTLKSLDETRANGSADSEQRLKDLAVKAEQAVRARADDLRERAEGLKTRARDYYEEATDRLDTAQRYLVERVQEKPVAATLAAVGVGVILGMLIAGGRRR